MQCGRDGCGSCLWLVEMDRRGPHGSLAGDPSRSPVDEMVMPVAISRDIKYTSSFSVILVHHWVLYHWSH